MSRGLNKVHLIGNVGGDPETKYTQGGMAITTISLATSSTRKDRDGNSKEVTEWHRIKFFGKTAEIAGEYLRKGSQVYVEGTIHYDKYDKDGETRYVTEILGNEMHMLGGRPEAERQAPRREAPRREAPAKAAPAPEPTDDFADDDIPF